MQPSLSPNAHAVWSPSSAEKWVNCPSSVKMEEKYPNESSEFSDEGTAAHFLASWCLDHEQEPEQHLDREIIFFEPKDAGEYVGWWPDRGSEYYEYVRQPGTLRKRLRVSQEMVDNIERYILEATTANGDGVMLVEQRLSIGHITGEYYAAGTADLVLLKPGELHVRDLKYGKGIQVFAERNKQLILYALAAYDVYKNHDMYLLEDMETVTIAIHQPRLNHLDEWTITVAELLEHRHQYEVAARLSRQILEGELLPDLYTKPGLHCSKGFCRAQATCPALKAHVIESCGFEDITDGMKDLDLDADAIGDSLKQVPILKAWIKKVEEEAFKRLTRGDAVTGYKLVPGREGNREWANEAEAVAKLSTLGFTAEQMYDKKLKSPTKVKEELKLSKQRFEELGPLIHRSAAGKTVVPENDKRAAVSNTDGFDNIE